MHTKLFFLESTTARVHNSNCTLSQSNDSEEFVAETTIQQVITMHGKSCDTDTARLAALDKKYLAANGYLHQIYVRSLIIGRGQEGTRGRK